MQVLWLYGNNITWIEGGAFSNLRVLEELDLGDNPLQRLESGAFRGLEKLQSLHMHRCKLAALPHDLFHKLYSLQFLYLQVNSAFPQQPHNTLNAGNRTQLTLKKKFCKTTASKVSEQLQPLHAKYTALWHKHTTLKKT